MSNTGKKYARTSRRDWFIRESLLQLEHYLFFAEFISSRLASLQVSPNSSKLVFTGCCIVCKLMEASRHPVNR